LLCTMPRPPQPVVWPAPPQPAVFVHGAYDVRVGELPRPEPKEDEVLVDIAAVGICGSDLHYYKDGGIGAATIDQPFVPGHEFAAYMVEDDEQLGTKAGELVAVDPARPCLACEQCHKAHHNLCPEVVFIGAPPYIGALTPQLAVARRQVVRVPQWFTPVQALMLEPLGVAIHAMDLAKPQLLESVAVVGCGPVGLKMIQLARLAGVAEVYAVDPVGYRAAAAIKAGAGEAAGTVKAIAELTRGRGVDLVLEATNSPDGLMHACIASRIGGRVVIVGIPDGNEYVAAADVMRRKGISLKMSRRMGEVYPRAINLVEKGLVDVDTMVTHQFALEDAPRAFEMQSNYEDNALKSVFNISDGKTS